MPAATGGQVVVITCPRGYLLSVFQYANRFAIDFECHFIRRFDLQRFVGCHGYHTLVYKSYAPNSSAVDKNHAMMIVNYQADDQRAVSY